MNNETEILINGSVRRYMLFVSMLKRDDNETVKLPLSNSNWTDIKNLLLKAFLAGRAEGDIEKAKEIIDGCFVSEKIYSVNVKHVQLSEGEKYSIIDMILTPTNSSILNIVNNHNYGYQTNISLTMPNNDYLYLSTYYYADKYNLTGGNYTTYINREKRDTMMGNALNDYIEHIYNQSTPSCATIGMEDILDKAFNKPTRKTYLYLSDSVEDGFSHKFASAGNLTERTYYIFKPNYGFVTLNNHKVKASMLNGKLVLTDSNDIFSEKYAKHLTEMASLYKAPTIFFYQRFDIYGKKDIVLYSFNNPKVFIISSVPKPLILQARNISSGIAPNMGQPWDGYLMNYELLVKTRHNKTSWINSRLAPRGDVSSLLIPYDPNEDTMNFVLGFYVKVLKLLNSANNEDKLTACNLIKDLYDNSEYIASIKSINNNISTIEAWFKQCCEQSEKNKEKLIENYTAMKARLIKEKIETNIYLQYHDYSKCLPIPSLVIKDLALDRIKNSIAFDMKTVTYDTIGRLHINRIEDRKLCIRMVLDTKFLHKKPNGEEVLETDLVDFYNAKENSIVISPDRIKEAFTK